MNVYYQHFRLDSPVFPYQSNLKFISPARRTLHAYNTTTLQLSGGLLKTGSIIGLFLNRFHDHSLEQDFERHGMTATLVSEKEFAIAVKNAISIADIMFIVVAVEGQFKLVEAKTCVVFRISFRFFQLADQSVIHRKLLLKKINKKARNRTRALGHRKRVM